MNIYLVNALPASVLVGDEKQGGLIRLVRLTHQEAAYIYAEGIGGSWAGVDPVPSMVGHADTAAIFAGLLGRHVPVVRGNVPALPQEGPGFLLLAGLYNGPRLPEGATTLPEGAEVNFYLVGRPEVAQGALREVLKHL